jgi:steroid 5-alpha reductase family enzyme
MFDISIFAYTLAVLFVIALALWILSRIKNDVGIVDSFWSLMILAAGICFLFFTDTSISDRHGVVILLLTVWALRLAAHITRRNWGQEEDSRYQAIRKNNQPNFEFKSLYIVFLLQAFLAAIIALPLMSIFASGTEMHGLDYFALALWLTGMFFETVSDRQLANFKSSSSNNNKVLNTGLWRYSRHPNYFGEFCIWWSFFLFALASGYWWSIVSPLLMTLLLLKVSGVSMLESTISERRPEYARYRRTTNAFFPWFPKKYLEL